MSRYSCKKVGLLRPTLPAATAMEGGAQGLPDFAPAQLSKIKQGFYSYKNSEPCHVETP